MRGGNEQNLGNEWCMHLGVRQEYMMSLWLFKVFIYRKILKNACRGMLVGDMNADTLLYADNAMLLSEKQDDL